MQDLFIEFFDLQIFNSFLISIKKVFLEYKETYKNNTVLLKFLITAFNYFVFNKKYLKCKYI